MASNPVKHYTQEQLNIALNTFTAAEDNYYTPGMARSRTREQIKVLSLAMDAALEEVMKDLPERNNNAALKLQQIHKWLDEEYLWDTAEALKANPKSEEVDPADKAVLDVLERLRTLLGHSWDI